MTEATVTYQYFTVEPREGRPGRKTRDYTLVNRSSGDVLGVVRFYASWRQHVFEPAGDTVWSAGCLRDVLAFLAKQAGLRRRKSDPSDPSERSDQ